jgi:fucose 4-O-acetylase-like acetyltransferase
MTSTVSRAGTADTTTDPRRPWPDNLRVFLIILVLAHHCALTYGHLPIWPYTETAAPQDRAAGALDLLVYVNQAWFMGMFFLISGLFVPGSADRRGLRSFVRGRLLRLGVPYLIFLLVLRPLFTLPVYLAVPAAQRPAYAVFYATSVDSGPSWFLLVLLLFSLGYAAVRSLGAPGADRLVVPGVRPGLGAALLLGLGLGVVSGCWRLLVPEASYWPVIGLPSPAYLPQYLVCFVVGVLAARRGWLDRLTTRDALVAVPVALVTGAVGLTLGLTAPGLGAGFPAAILLSVFAAALITALLVLFRSRLDVTNPVLRSASANAFAVYLIHPAVLVWVAVVISPLVAALPHLGRFAVLLVVGCGVCWLLAILVRRLPGARRII